MFEIEAEENVNKSHWLFPEAKDIARAYWRDGAEYGYNRADEEYKKLFLKLEQNIRDLADPSMRYDVYDLAEDWEVEL